MGALIGFAIAGGIILIIIVIASVPVILQPVAEPEPLQESVHEEKDKVQKSIEVQFHLRNHL